MIQSSYSGYALLIDWKLLEHLQKIRLHHLSSGELLGTILWALLMFQNLLNVIPRKTKRFKFPLHHINSFARVEFLCNKSKIKTISLEPKNSFMNERPVLIILPPFTTWIKTKQKIARPPFNIVSVCWMPHLAESSGLTTPSHYHHDRETTSSGIIHFFITSHNNNPGNYILWAQLPLDGNL